MKLGGQLGEAALCLSTHLRGQNSPDWTWAPSVSRWLVVPKGLWLLPEKTQSSWCVKPQQINCVITMFPELPCEWAIAAICENKNSWTKHSKKCCQVPQSTVICEAQKLVHRRPRRCCAAINFDQNLFKVSWEYRKMYFYLFFSLLRLLESLLSLFSK